MENKKDYIMRMLQLLFEAILKIEKALDLEDEEGARKQIDFSYQLLGKNRDFFLMSSSEVIITHLSSTHYDLAVFEYVSKLLYYEFSLSKLNEPKYQSLLNAKQLLEYHMNNSM
ncbi:hypothetical protein F6U93_14365 [Tamlana haliotis]|uniref:Uncharacterized protein n=1 Tax=Pseudotamlana haliotis TaxID=2614804 RepID=A0A6N6M967_9FLAO|nr:hypothetical protein [Tamlana haliotis]KAB1066598.1 hypothetical protein F6U93_14365 [Tamlana haliotis]